jgi:outer membrane protein OmpA-like peptidoglycan-associated protein
MDTELDIGTSKNRPMVSMGIEKWFSERTFAVRAGWQTVADGGNTSLGGSYRKKFNRYTLGLDFAYVYPVRMEELPVYRFSLLYWVGEKEAKEEVEKPADVVVPQSGIPADVVPTFRSAEEVAKEEGKTKMTELIKMIQDGKLYEIKFTPDSDKIIQGLDTMDKIGQLLSEHKNVKIKIEAHTSPMGDPNVLLALSSKRAEKIKEYILTKYKIDAKRIETIGYGGTRLIYPLEKEIRETKTGIDGKSEVTTRKQQIPGNLEKNERIEISIIEE